MQQSIINVFGFRVVGDWIEHERSVFHTSSSAGEVFQIVVEPEEDHNLRFDVHLLDSPYDVELHWQFASDAGHKVKMFERIVHLISAWASHNA